MNPDAPRTPREELEIRITALLMGQLAPDEAAEVEAQIAADPGLAQLHTRMARAAELLREARALKDAPIPTEPLQLSKDRREQLLAKFRGINALPTVPKTPSRPYPARPVPPFPEREPRSWRPLILAASIAALIVVPFAFFGPSALRKGNIAYGPPAPNSPSSDNSLLHVGQDGGVEYQMAVPPPEAAARYAYAPSPQLTSPPSIGSGQVLPKLRVAGTSAPSTPSLDVISTRSASSGAMTRQPERLSTIYLPSVKSEVGATTREKDGQKLAKNETALHFATPESKRPADNAAPLAEGLADVSRSRWFRDREKATIFSDDSGPRNVPGTARGDGTTTEEGESTVKREVRRRDTREQSGAGESTKRLSAKSPAVTPLRTGPLADVQLPDTGAIDARAFGQIPMGEALPADSINDAESQQLARAAGTGTAKGKENLNGIASISNKPTEEGRKAELNAPVIAELPTDFALRIEAEDASKRNKFGTNPDNALQERILDMDPTDVVAPTGRGDKDAKKQQAADTAHSVARSQGMWEVSNEWRRPYRRSDQNPARPDPTAASDASSVAKPFDPQLGIAGAKAANPAQPAMDFDGSQNYWAFQGRSTAGEAKRAEDALALGLQSAGQPGLQWGDAPAGSARQYFDTLDQSTATGRAKSKEQAAGEQFKESSSPADLNNPILAYSEPNSTAGLVQLENLFIPPPAPVPATTPATPVNPAARPEGPRAATGVNPAQESFVNGFLAARKAEDYLAAGDTQKALETYRSAADTLAKIKEQWPNWQPELLQFRQKRTQESIAELEAKLEKGAKATDSKAGGVKPASGPATEPPATPKPPEPPPVPQPEVSTKDNAFSTFSLNVSDVSFQLAAASLDRGRIPDAASVRSEEFINALDYRDPEPSASAPLAFTSERARYPFAHNRDLLRLSLKTAAAGRAPGRPLNLVLLVDNSGSMERADRVSILKESMRVLSQQLKAEDKVSLITFSREPRLWADGVAGDKAAEATQRASEITPQGGTDLSAALDLGYKIALKHYKTDSINRVVLLTDGAANLGEVKAETLKAKVETHRKQGVAFDCFGVGWEGYNDDLLEQLSRNGDGRYGFINTPEAAAKEFAGQLAGALRVAASDVKVQVEFNARRVTSYRQIGYAKHQLKKEQFRDNTVDAAEIGAAESGNALYVVEVNAGGSGDIGIARARFKVPGTSDYRELEWTIPYQAPAPAIEQASSSLRLAATACAFSEWLAQSPYAAEVTTDRLLALINGIPAIYGADNRPAKLEAMIRQAKSISGR